MGNSKHCLKRRTKSMPKEVVLQGPGKHIETVKIREAHTEPYQIKRKWLTKKMSSGKHILFFMTVILVPAKINYLLKYNPPHTTQNRISELLKSI